MGSIPGSGRSPGGGHSNPLQYSCLENPHGQRSLAGYTPWGHKELDAAEQLSTTKHLPYKHKRKQCKKPSIVQSVRVIFCTCILTYTSSKVCFCPSETDILKLIWQVVQGNYNCPLVGMEIAQLNGWAQVGLPGLIL